MTLLKTAFILTSQEDGFFKIYKNLGEKLSKMTIYRLELDKDKFISECISEINELLAYRKVETLTKSLPLK